MLQWMGGSRRKVATSRKSTQKRQKQYFEQRRRQQQQQHATGTEDILDEENMSHQQKKNNQSLDVLSFLNLSAMAWEHKPSCPSAQDELEGDTFPVDYQTVKSPIAMQANNLNPADKFRTIDARNLSSFEAATTYREKVSVNVHGSFDKAAKEDHERFNGLGMATEHQLSVIELLGDDGPSNNFKGGALREAHVAFSIEGLGKVVTETPVHSPNVQGRTLSSPSMAKRRAHSVKNFSCGSDIMEPDLDSMMWDINLPAYASSTEQPSCSRDPVEFFHNQKSSKSSAARQFPLLTSDSSNLKKLFEDDEPLYHGETRHLDFRNASSSLSPCEDDHMLYGEEWVDQMDAGFADYLNMTSPGEQDFISLGFYLPKKRTNINATGVPLSQEMPHLHFQQQTPQNLIDFDFADETWKFKAGRSSVVRQVEKEPLWSDFASEDGGESLSLLSEESCSAAAVRVDATKKPPSKSLEKHEYGADSMSQENKRSWKTTSTNERDGNNRNPHRKESNKNGWRTCKRELSFPNPAHNSNTRSGKIISPDISGLFGGGYEVGENLSLNPLCHTPDAKKHTIPSCDLWTKDTYDAPPYMKPHVNSNPIFERPGGYPAKFSPCSTFISERLDLGQPFNDMGSLHTFLPNTISGYSMPNLSKDSTERLRDLNSLSGLGSLGQAENCSGRDAGKIADTLSADGGRFESQLDVSGSNGLSMETEKSSNASDFEEKSTDSKAPVSRTPEKVSVATKSLEEAEDTSSSVEIPDLLDNAQCSINERECQHDAQVSFPCQSACKEASGMQETSVAHNSAADQACQIVIVKSCVHQLLHFQILKEASLDRSIKKISLEKKDESIVHQWVHSEFNKSSTYTESFSFL